MTNEKTLTYSVIITISLPGQEGETSLHLTLGPADQVPGPGGSQRLLQDCTLADLQQFADALEAELWQEYLDATLVDMVVDESLQINFEFDEAQDDAAPTGQLLLDHVVIFPATEQPAKGEYGAQTPPDLGDERGVAGKAVPDETDQLPQDAQALDAPDGVSSISATGQPPDKMATVEEIESSPSAAETPATALPGTNEESESAVEELEVEEITRVDEEPLVTVSEAQPIHEEREALVEPGLPVAPPRFRILGRRRPLGHRTPSAVDILINETAFRDAQAHAISSPEREVAGVLVGPPPEKQPDGRYVVHISDMIIAKHTRMQGASVTYTPESWRYVNDRLAEMYPDDTAVIVGWYHTHPGFGIFLSGMDRFIHHNFFTQIWHVALVLDPLARRSGFFSWDRSKSQVNAYEFPWPSWAVDSW